MDQPFEIPNTTRAFAEFQILGIIVDIANLPGKVRVGVRSNYLRRNRAGQVVDEPTENHVDVVHRATRRYVQKHATVGQLVLVRGRITGELVADQFHLFGATSDPNDA